MPIGSAPSRLNPGVPLQPASNWALLAAGTYDLVALGNGACATRVVAQTADTWTIEKPDGTSYGPIGVAAGFSHVAQTRGITCAGPIAVYW